MFNGKRYRDFTLVVIHNTRHLSEHRPHPGIY